MELEPRELSYWQRGYLDGYGGRPNQWEKKHADEVANFDLDGCSRSMREHGYHNGYYQGTSDRLAAIRAGTY